MSDLNSVNLHRKVDALMDRFFGAGVASHQIIIEQINYLLFMRALSYRDDEHRALGINDKSKIVFDGELEKYKWENLLSLNAENLFVALEDSFRKIPESTTNKAVRLVFRDAHLKLFDKPTLSIVMHEIDKFARDMDNFDHQGHKDVYGDTYEYLLSKLAQAGTSGQFRTPRHIIEFMVKIIAPKKGEKILDPAAGTAGFLVKAFEYLRNEYSSGEPGAGTFDKLTAKEQNFLYEHTFSGFDSDADMIKFGMMNLYLHGLQNAELIRQNSLTDTAGNRDKYDVILANPPFSGKIDRDSVAQELQMSTGATEVLFLRYMLEHLGPNGRAGVIVPEGVLFNTSGAHTKIRQMLLENGLWCVVSLPAGTFNPYAGVKTSIVFFDKSRSNKKEVLFAKIESDGFSMNAQRRAVAQDDIPEIVQAIQRFQAGEEPQILNAHVVTHDQIAKSKDLNLNGDRYKVVEKKGKQKWPIIKLDNHFEFVRGVTYSKKDEVLKNGHKILRANNIDPLSHALSLVDVKEIDVNLALKDSQILKKNDIFICTASGSKDHIGKVAFIEDDTDYYFGGFMGVIRVSEELESKYLYYQLRDKRFNDFLQTHLAGASINNLKAEMIKNFEIPLPPKEIQREVVAELDNYQSVIDAARVIGKIEGLNFDVDENWPKTKVENLFEKVTDSWSPGSNMEFSIFVGLEDIAKNTGELIRVNRDSPTSTKTRFQKNDILYGKLRPNLNKVWCADIDNGICSTDFLVLRPKNTDRTLTAFYAPYFRSKSFNKAVMYGISGANLPRVSPDHFMSIEIPNPDAGQLSELVVELENMQQAVLTNKKLIKLFDHKIKNKIAQIWGG